MNDLRERRVVRRHNVSIALKYRLWKSEMPEVRAEALNLSEGGVYFATDSVVEKEETVQVRFQMPESVVDELPAEWLCTGQVIRVDRVGGLNGKLGVAVRFDCYEIARPDGMTAIQLDSQSFRLGFFSRPAPRRTSVAVKSEPQTPEQGASRAVLLNPACENSGDVIHRLHGGASLVPLNRRCRVQSFYHQALLP